VTTIDFVFLPSPLSLSLSLSLLFSLINKSILYIYYKNNAKYCIERRRRRKVIRAASVGRKFLRNSRVAGRNSATSRPVTCLFFVSLFLSFLLLLALSYASVLFLAVSLKMTNGERERGSAAERQADSKVSRFETVATINSRKLEDFEEI